MAHTIAIIVIVFLLIMIIDPYIALWQMTRSVSQRISSLEWSVNDLSFKMLAFTATLPNPSTDIDLELARKDLDIAKTDLKLAKQDLAAKQHNLAMTTAEDGLKHALEVRKFLESRSNNS